MDRAMNPHDGSRRRLKSSAHKSIKDYDRRINKQIKKEDTMESIEEGNKLIAEFMNVDIAHGNMVIDKWTEHSPMQHRWLNVQNNMWTKMRFHSDWNWIMPVVVECFNRYDAVEDSLSNHQFILNDALLETNIESLHKAVVEFIKWYNAAAIIKDKE